MKQAGIVLDKYKRKLFEKRLKGANFDYKVAKKSISPDTVTIYLNVEDERVPELTKLIEAMNNEARRSRHN